MRQLTTAALLAAALLFVGTSSASANDGPCTYGYGCGGICLGLFSKIHQHGPLYNYGPYYGYPPFEPYGPWNPYLRRSHRFRHGAGRAYVAAASGMPAWNAVSKQATAGTSGSTDDTAFRAASDFGW